MTVFQIQCLLAYLGYYTIAIDGIWGKKSTEATENFQRDFGGLSVTGSPDQDTQKALKHAVAYGMEKNNSTSQPSTPEQEESTEYAAEYLQSDGCYHIPRGVNVQLSKNLWSSEIMCQGVGCCNESIISKRVVDAFQRVRDIYGGPITIGDSGGSGYRCPIHNASPTVKGASNSLHLTGNALDLHASDTSRLLWAVEQVVTDGEIGIYNWGIHMGVWSRGYVNRFYG